MSAGVASRPESTEVLPLPPVRRATPSIHRDSIADPAPLSSTMRMVAPAHAPSPSPSPSSPRVDRGVWIFDEPWRSAHTARRVVPPDNRSVLWALVACIVSFAAVLGAGIAVLIAQ